MNIEKYYGFQFCGPDGKRELIKTYLPINQLEIDHLISDGLERSFDLKFKALYGLIRELSLVNEKVRLNIPSKVGGEKYQAFIIKRKGDVITGEGSSFYLNGEKLHLNFISYDVTIIDLNNEYI